MGTNYNKHYHANYTIDTIPETSDYDELCYIINYGLRVGEYQKLKGKYCGDKANILFNKSIEPNYEIY